MLVAFELVVKFFKHVFGCMNCWLDAASHLLTTTAWRFDFALTAGVDCHSTFIARISGHHIAPHEIDIKQKNDDRPAGVCPDAPMIFGINWCSA